MYFIKFIVINAHVQHMICWCIFIWCKCSIVFNLISVQYILSEGLLYILGYRSHCLVDQSVVWSMQPCTAVLFLDQFNSNWGMSLLSIIASSYLWYCFVFPLLELYYHLWSLIRIMVMCNCFGHTFFIYKILFTYKIVLFLCMW